MAKPQNHSTPKVRVEIFQSLSYSLVAEILEAAAFEAVAWYIKTDYRVVYWFWGSVGSVAMRWVGQRYEC